MIGVSALSDAQIDALASVSDALRNLRWAVIGASAIRCLLPLPRPTEDLDFVVAASGDQANDRLRAAGWAPHERKPMSWRRSGARIDAVSVTDEDLLAGTAEPTEGVILTVIGLDLAFTERHLVRVREGMDVPVARLPVLTLLKMIAWLDRPHDREKDLHDLLFMWDSALPDDDEVRWDPTHPVSQAGLEFDDQSAFFIGFELGRIARPEHLHWARRFLDVMRNEDSVSFAQLVRAAPHVGDGREQRVRARLNAFERGLEAAVVGLVTPPQSRPERAPARVAARPLRPPFAPAGVAPPGAGWRRTGSLEMTLHTAIDQRRIVRFSYRSHPRIAEVHVLGIRNGRLQILTWQTGGYSSSGGLPGWRSFLLNEIVNLQVLEETFSGPRLPWGRHSAFDQQIAVVRR